MAARRPDDLVAGMEHGMLPSVSGINEHSLRESTTAVQGRGAQSPLTRDWAATTFVVHKGRTLLLRHRKLNRWLPPGGHIEPHELPDVAALREVEEETGLRVALLDGGSPLGPVQRLAQPLCILLEQIGPGHEHIDLIYAARVIDGEVHHAPQEAHEARWYGHAELAGVEIAEDIRLLGRRAIALVDSWERGA